MQALIRAYVATATLVSDRLAAARKNESGVSVLEYVGLLVIIGGVIAAISSMGLGDMITGAIEGAIQQITGGGN